MQTTGYSFEETIDLLEFRPYGGEETRRLFFVKDRNKYENPYIYLALEKAKKYNADAVYFRFLENQIPIPQIYVYDNTNKPVTEQELTEKQRRIWNSAQVPLLYIFTKTEVLIVNTYNGPKIVAGNIKFDLLERIKIGVEIDKQLKYSGKSFDNGFFWEEDDNRKKFSLSKSAFEKLITALKEVRKELLNANVLNKNEKLSEDRQKIIVHKLLVMSIFLKYLEEKEDDNGNTVFQDGFFKNYHPQANNFIEVLNYNGDAVRLFRDLSNHFNGEIFKLTIDKEKDIDEEKDLKKLNLSKFAEFFEGKTEKGGQGTLWRLYSFKDLPVELISNIYEEFIEGKKDGIVYTPPFLVNFLIDEVLPLNSKHTNTEVKILDPACGSGIFLVQAYKRLIHRWRFKNNWAPPSKDILKKILLDNIYGVDKEEDAIRLTAFSLTLALCDELSPLVIWKELKFDTLRNINLHDKDFFEVIEQKKLPTDFDIVIGNPPFIDKLTESARQIEEMRTLKGVPKLPDNQLSLLFLDQALLLCKKNGRLCLILPSGPFLYNIGSFDFRTHILKNYNLEYIVDFTHLSRFLFGSGKGDHPTLAVFIHNQPPSEEDIIHITVRKTKSAKEKIWIELDKYDYHIVPFSLATSNEKGDRLVWKSNFIGGGRIHSIMKRLAKQRTLKEFIDSNKTWVQNEGFIVGKKGERKPAKFLTGNRFIPTKLFTEKGINEKDITILKEKLFINPKTAELFEPPLVLIKEVVGKKTIIIAYRKDKITFKHNIVGVHAPQADANKLIQIEKRIRGKEIFLFYVAGYSSQYLISKSTAILKADIDNLPYPENEKDTTPSEIERVLIEDVLNYFLEYRHIHSDIVEAEKIVSNNHLLSFAEYYLKILNSVYKTYKASAPIITNNHIIFPFYWGNKPETIGNITELEKYLNQLLLDNHYPSANLRFIRIMRIYDDNVIYLIKPKQLRYWLRSVAIRDADETFAYLVKQEYGL